ncbi:hypothetical protein V6N13_091696 [Hibiscus sabdariffa]
MVDFIIVIDTLALMLLAVATHVFNAKEICLGFTSFLSLAEFHNPRRGYLVNDACLIVAYITTNMTRGLISHNSIVSHELLVENDSAIGNRKTTITTPAPSSSQPSCQIVDIEPKEPTKEDMNTFFSSLEFELLSSNTVFPQEEAKEALAKLEAALNMTPINFHDSGEFSPLKLAFKILASVGCSCTNLTIEQKNKLSAMEESLKQLADRAAKAVEDKNRLTAKESFKKTVTYNLECSLIRYNEVESQVKQMEQKLTGLQEQVEEAQKKRKSMLTEQKGIFISSKKMKMELEALSKELAECEAKAKVAEDEEKTVEAEWGRMKHFISSIKEDIKRALEEKYGGEEEVVRFRSLEKPKEDEFSLELSKLHNYDDVVEKVAHHLGLNDPSKIRLTSHNCYSQQPKPQPIKYRGVEHLSDMLLHYNQTSDILYYEVLDIPLPELQGLKTLKVAFHHATKDEVVIHTIRLPKLSTVGDVLDDLKTKVELSHPGAELRLLEVFYHKIYKIFPPNEKIENINYQYWTLRAEEIPEEEKNLGPHDRLIHVYHFLKDTTQNQVQNFGEPFFLVIHETETLAEVKVRIQKRLRVPDEEFAKWKFAFISLAHPDYLQDSDVVATRFQGRGVYGAWEQYLGLEHSDNAPKRSYAANHQV